MVICNQQAAFTFAKYAL